MPVFCCTARTPYRPIRTDQEDKFSTFLSWADGHAVASSSDGHGYVIQAVKQVNFGPVQQVTYFLRTANAYKEVSEEDVIQAKLHKTNAYKNYVRCTQQVL